MEDKLSYHFSPGEKWKWDRIVEPYEWILPYEDHSDSEEVYWKLIEKEQ